MSRAELPFDRIVDDDEDKDELMYAPPTKRAALESRIPFVPSIEFKTEIESERSTLQERLEQVQSLENFRTGSESNYATLGMDVFDGRCNTLARPVGNGESQLLRYN